MTPLAERGLPANIDAERFLLGSILLNGESYADISGVLSAADFSLEKHRRIFGRMKDLFDRGENIDRLTLSDELQKRGELESVDGLSYLISLDDGLPQLPHLDDYVRIVRDRALLRETMSCCQTIIDQCAMASEPSCESLRLRWPCSRGSEAKVKSETATGQRRGKF
jgi:replicative DNA helicase